MSYDYVHFHSADFVQVPTSSLKNVNKINIIIQFKLIIYCVI